MIQRGQKYTHPLLESRKVKFGLVNCVLVTIIVLGLSLGLSNRETKEGKELGDQIGKLEEELAKDKEEDSGQAGDDGNMDWWLQDKQTVESDAEKMVNMVTGEDDHLSAEDMAVYQAAVTRYQPKEFNRQEGWVGKTYLDAYRFCGELGYEICPYDALCPLGTDHQPMGGYKDRPGGESWTAIASGDESSDWVQLGRENACVRYSAEHAGQPEWSVGGDEDADEVAHVTCCAVASPFDDDNDDNNGVVPGDPDFALYQGVAEKYLPRHFDRNKGWAGRTYVDALKFCGAKAGYEICPYDAVCPLGVDSEPLGGTKKGGEAWIPVLDSANDWVQIGEGDPCIRWSEEHGSPPTFDLNGDDDGEITRHVICCVLRLTDEDSVAGGGAEQQQEEEEAAIAPATMNGNGDAYGAVLEKYLPREFDRDDGWDGRTYAQAHYFCSNALDNYAICPFEALCPGGPAAPPLLGIVTNPEAAEEWMPISDVIDDWIQVTEQNPCIKFSSMNPELPEWGVTGKGSKKITGHITCCLKQDDDETSEAGGDEGGAALPPSKQELYEIEMAYRYASETYHPVQFGREKGWSGTTYEEAFEFCGRHDGHNLCPYDAICPAGGPGREPIGGYRRGAGGSSWVPVLIEDGGNEWVQVDSNPGSCGLYSDESGGEAPEWGMTGEGDEGLTRHLICCADLEAEGGGGGPNEADGGEVKEDPAVAQMMISVVGKYAPIPYGREDGWEGKTYLEAIEYCANREGYEICPYEAVCPRGPNTASLMEDILPVGDDVEVMWVPLSDSPNDWVNVGSAATCIRYSYEAPGTPEWGTTGENGEETARLMCCKGSIYGGAEEDFLYELATDKYHPMTYDRDRGWAGSTHDEAVEFCEGKAMELCPYEAYCPVADLDLPMGGVRLDGGASGSWAPFSGSGGWISIGPENTCEIYDVVNGEMWVDGWWAEEDDATGNVMCCSGTDPSLEAEAITNDVEQFQPIGYGREDGWEGATYLEAVQFCANKEGYEICPYQAVCPLGPNTPSVMGDMVSVGDDELTWVPLSDDYNDWASLGSDGAVACLRYTSVAANKPDWGMNGGNREGTSFIMCCEGSIWGGAEESFMYQLAGDEHQPAWYDRDRGWTGETHDEAVDFCEGKAMELCPYEAYCPVADLDHPMGGTREDGGPSGSWAPFGNDDEGGAAGGWVSIGPRKTCEMYDAVANEMWVDGWAGDEDVTGHIMCCGGGGGQEEDAGATSPEAPAVPPATEVAAEAAAIAQVYASVEHFQPVGYGREDGWDGATYLDAVKFCMDKEGYHICPYEALCPMGLEGDSVLEGSVPFDEEEATWVPISNDSNDWVNLNPNTYGTCVRYTAAHPDKPDWGMNGDDREATAFTMCCVGSISDGAGKEFMYQVAANKHHPVPYDRDAGWTGQTYFEAAAFCGAKSASLCPYEAYCPLGDRGDPMGGAKDDGGPSGTWAPIGDAIDGWISIGEYNTCEPYQVFTPEEWKGGNEEMTRHIMCCDGEGTDIGATSPEVPAVTASPSKKPTSSPTPMPSRKPTPRPTPLPSKKPTPAPVRRTPAPTPLPSRKPTLPPISGAMGTALETFKSLEEYNPVWYDRSSGWTGQTYDDAFSFCSGKGTNHDICPYEVICPSGPLSMPFGGSKPGETLWAPVNQPFNSWVQVGNQKECVRYEASNEEDHPMWGLTGIDAEPLTRYVACCDMEGATGTGGQSDVTNPDMYASVVGKYAPKWFGRDEGWDGKTYENAINFCASQDSSIPCPYEAYCPGGEGSAPTLGHFGEEKAWAAIMDVPNGWVQIGRYEENSISSSCVEYNSLHRTPPLWGIGIDESADTLNMSPRVMCCNEPADGVINEFTASPLPVATAKTTGEQEILKDMDPIWFGRRHGYRGTTWGEASDFCKAVGDMVLCPRSAYCPGTENELFLEKYPFEGEQWSPAASDSRTGQEFWISVGNDRETCATHEELQLSPPGWALDGSRQELKENVLCCQNPKYLAKEQGMQNDLNPIWMDVSHGWDGGSHDDAIQFCDDFGNRKLCPYAIYCPHGPGQAVMGGHKTDFNTEGEQWAPIYGPTSSWVMIGQKYQNHATTCMNSQSIEGVMPDWGMSKENANLKKNIACCSF